MAVSDGFTYSLAGSNATITAYDPTVSSQGYTPTIPATLDGYTVVAIGTSAFASKSLTAVTINTAINLGDLAFDNNSGIDVTINANVTTTTIGSTTDVPFYRCNIGSGLTIGSSCTTIAQRLFCNCGLTSVTLPSTLVTINDYGFSTNSSLASVTFDYAVNLGDKSFGDCGNISVTLNVDITTTLVSSLGPFDGCTIGANLTIGSGVTAIPSYLFRGCGLTSVTIGSNVTIINWEAFKNNSLTALTIPTACTDIRAYAFDTNSIASLTFGHVVNLRDKSFGSNGAIAVTINADLTITFGTYGPFEGCTIGSGITLQSSCTSIPYGLFKNSGVTALTIPSTCTKLYGSSFANNSIASLTFSNAITIYDSSFASNGAIAVTLNANISVNYVTTSPFNSCTIGSGVTIGASCSTVPNYLFKNAGVTSLTIPSTCTEIKQSAFSANSISSLTFNNTCLLNTTAFESNGSISVTLNANLTTSCITDGPFKSCTIGSGLTIQSGCTSIPAYLFKSSGLTSLTIGANVTTINDYAFQSNSLTSLTIPSTCTTIKTDAFTSNSIASLTFNNTCLLYTRCFSSNGAISITLNADLTTSCVTDGPFKSCTIGANLIIQSGCTTIPDYLFQSSGLTSLTLPSSVISIKDYAFKSNSLTSLTFNSAVDLEINCFASNIAIAIVINANITCNTLGLTSQGPFLSCALASGVTVQSGCTAIPKYLFSQSGLIAIDLHSNVASIGNYAFYDNDALRTIYIRNASLTFGTNILDGSTPTSPKGTIYGHANSTARTWASGYTTNYVFYAWFTPTRANLNITSGVRKKIGIKKSTNISVSSNTKKKVKVILKALLSITDALNAVLTTSATVYKITLNAVVGVTGNIIKGTNKTLNSNLNITPNVVKKTHTTIRSNINISSNNIKKISVIKKSLLNVNSNVAKKIKSIYNTNISITANTVKHIKKIVNTNIAIFSVVSTILNTAATLYKITLSSSIGISSNVIKKTNKIVSSNLQVASIARKKVKVIKGSLINILSRKQNKVSVIKQANLTIASTNIKKINILKQANLVVSSNIIKGIKIIRQSTISINSTNKKHIKKTINTIVSILSNAIKKTSKVFRSNISVGINQTQTPIYGDLGVLEELYYYLIQLGEVTDIYMDFEPEQPANLVVLFEEESGPPVFDTDTMVRFVTVVVRNQSAILAKHLADRVYAIFNPADRFLQLVSKKCIIMPTEAVSKQEPRQPYYPRYGFKLAIILTDRSYDLPIITTPSIPAESNLLVDIVTLLTAQLLVTGEAVDCFRNFMPDKPDNVTVIFEYTSGKSMPYDTTVVRSIQITVRNKSANVAKTKAKAIWNLFTPTNNELLIGTQIRIINPRNEPFKLMVDSNNRVYYALNIGIVTKTD